MVLTQVAHHPVEATELPGIARASLGRAAKSVVWKVIHLYTGFLVSGRRNIGII